MTTVKCTVRFAGLCALSALVAACGEDNETAAAASSTDTATSSGAGPGTPTSNVRTNEVPIISGTPPGSVVAGTLYQFRPSTRDADGDTLTYTIFQRPAWAAFDRTSGRLQGVPGTADAGLYKDIVIAVTDGEAKATLKAFSVLVMDPYAAIQPVVPTVPTSPSVSSPPTTSTPTTSTTTPTTTIAPANVAPTIRGVPPTSVLVGNPYTFRPNVTDIDGDALSFSISNRPPWATFNSSIGRLLGTPSAGDVGTYTNITIRVSDGAATASLPAFSIKVMAVGNGSATLSWMPPTQNEDGSPLTNLAGYKIHWGTSSGDYSNNVTINNSGITSYVVENLVPGTYYFALSAFTSSGLASAFSNEGNKTIQ